MRWICAVMENRTLFHVLVFSIMLSAVSSVLAGEIAQREEKRVSVSWFRQVFAKLSWEETISVVKTPRQICAAVRRRVEYREDLGDEWAGGKETWDREYGDCEDIAASVVDLCRARGLDARILIFFPENAAEGHAAAVGVIGNKIWISSNGWYDTADSLDEAKRKIAREMRWKWGRRKLVASTLSSANRPERIALPNLSASTLLKMGGDIE